MKHLLSSPGFLTLEILVAVTLLVLAATLSYTPSTTFLRQYHRMQVRIATQHFANDIRRLQQKAIFGNNISDKLLVLTNNEGYYWDDIHNNEQFTTLFNAIGCEGVFFKQKVASLMFYPNGSPFTSGNYTYVLGHRSESSFSCKLTIQVASGRLDISEIN